MWERRGEEPLGWGPGITAGHGGMGPTVRWDAEGPSATGPRQASRGGGVYSAGRAVIGRAGRAVIGRACHAGRWGWWRRRVAVATGAERRPGSGAMAAEGPAALLLLLLVAVAGGDDADWVRLPSKCEGERGRERGERGRDRERAGAEEARSRQQGLPAAPGSEGKRGSAEAGPRFALSVPRQAQRRGGEAAVEQFVQLSRPGRRSGGAA